MDASPEIVEVVPGILRLQLPIDSPAWATSTHTPSRTTRASRWSIRVSPVRSRGSALGRMDQASIPLATRPHRRGDPFAPGSLRRRGVVGPGERGDIVASNSFRTFFDPEDIDDRELEAADDIDPAENPIPNLRLERAAPGVGRTVGPPPEARERMLSHQEQFFRWFRPPRPSRHVADSDHITLGGRDWVGLFTPGHTNDHLCLYDEETGVLLSGDQVLPTITPHISGLFPAIRSWNYLESLDRLSDSPPRDDRAASPWPAVPRPARPRRRDEDAPRRTAAHCSRSVTQPAGPTWSTCRTSCSPTLVGLHGRGRDLRPPGALPRHGRPAAPRRGGDSALSPLTSPGAGR